MKLFASILIASLALCASAQTNITSIPGDILNLGQQVVTGPWGVAAGYGHALTGGNNNIAFEIVTYDLVTNVQNTGFSSGVIAGYSELFGKGKPQLNSVSGGWQFSETGKPLAFIGSTFLTNLTATIDLYQVVATPRGGSDIGSVTGTSLSLDLYEWDNFHLKAVGLYENRNGQTGYNGNYLLGGIAITHLF